MQAYFKHILKSKQENWYNLIDQTLKFLHSFMQSGQKRKIVDLMNNIMEITIMKWEQISKAIMKVSAKTMWNVQLAKTNLFGIIYEGFIKIMII